MPDKPTDLLAADAQQQAFAFTAEASPEWGEVQAAESGSPKIPTFSMLAYTGGPMRVSGFYHPIVIDLAGMKSSNKTIPIFRQHDPLMIVGHGQAEISATDIRASGLVSADNEHSREVLSSSKAGFPWQASVGASIESAERLKDGEKAVVNGKTVSGPMTIARKTTLSEISFVPLGADRKTHTKVAAAATLAELHHRRPADAASVTLAELHSRRKS